MPSKRGSRASGGGGGGPLSTSLPGLDEIVRPQVSSIPADTAGTVSSGTPEAMDLLAPAFDTAELARGLRRGPEVDRFNELSARQESLSSEESDELYRYRLRRLLARLRKLERIAGSGDEEPLRQALDDFRQRLQELRTFEAARREAGLSAGYPVEPFAEEQAMTRLLAIASQRPHGLVAGAEAPPNQPSGSMRIREVAFAPSPDDVPVWVLVPSSIPSEAVVHNIESVASEGARIRVVREASEVPRGDSPALILNWGSVQPLPQEAVALNEPEAVRAASDQVESLGRLRELAPRTVLNPGDLALLGSSQIVGKRRRGSRGSGKAVLQSEGPQAERAGYDCFQEFIPNRREYRVSVLSGRIVTAYLKRPPEGATPDDLRPAWSFERSQVIPRSVAAVAREGARRVGLDYAGVDVIEDLQTGRVYCLEANAAPGMSEETVKSVYAHIQQTLRGRLARAG
ncbi:MAG: hypothetical protein JWM24_2269 [Solirubrobacterales bacterium]|nr:hypothetical protein [Solirubrobacterales bacterium]